MSSLAFLSNLAHGDLIVILLIILLLFGSKKLPELARGLGQAMKEFHKGKDELTGELPQPVATANMTASTPLSGALAGEETPPPPSPSAVVTDRAPRAESNT